MSSYYRNTVAGFLSDTADRVFSALVRGDSISGFRTVSSDQTFAWGEQIRILRDVCAQVAAISSRFGSAGILFEFRIPRRNKRIDTVILVNRTLLVLEFKVGGKEYLAADIEQVEDYALDLYHYHAESRNANIIPMLCATGANSCCTASRLTSGQVASTILLGARHLADCVGAVACVDASEYGTDWIRTWDDSSYQPIPTIIDSAVSLFSDHGVDDIRHSLAGEEGVARTSRRLLQIARDSKRQKRKSLVLVSGVPGAGKTLTGLQMAHHPDMKDLAGIPGVFVSGNGPLVKVIAEALARDHNSRTGTNLTTARGKAETFIQNVHTFIAENQKTNRAPADM
jgi:hypothetical protein